jgi:SAM-dependent methyltransferase
MPDEPRSSPAADRNKQPILDALRGVLPASGHVLEIASGTGQHVAHFAAALPNVIWHPSDTSSEARADVLARIAAAGLVNVHEPIALDVHDDPWPVAGPLAGIVCINMVHIAPWSATLALMRGAARLLPDGAHLVLYGPFREGGRHIAESNAAFDASLRERDASWGVRDLEAVSAVAAEYGLMQHSVVRMPANNLTVIFRRVEPAAAR